MIRAQEDLLEACFIIKNTGKLHLFYDFLEESRESCRERLETQQDTNLIKQLQGEAQAYKKLLNLFDEAEAYRDK